METEKGASLGLEPINLASFHVAVTEIDICSSNPEVPYAYEQLLVDYSIDKPPASDTPYTILVLSELLDMSQKAEQTSAAGDSWKQVDKGTASQQDIEAIYKSIWSDRKPAAGANLTDMERMQYGRQNSAGLGAQGDGQCKEAERNSGRASYDLPNQHLKYVRVKSAPPKPCHN